MAPGPATALNIFISYAHEDEGLREELENHLAPLKAAARLEIWTDRRIAPGAYWNDDIQSHFDAAQIILLLLSADFFASEFCMKEEMPRALQMHSAGKATVIPIIARAVVWEDSPLHALQASPKDAKPVTSWTNRDDAWRDVVEAVRKVIPGLACSGNMESAGDSAKAGVQALAQLMDATEVREAVVSFRKEFEVTRSQIEVMGDYKDIHDQLHFLKVNCYDCIVMEVKRFPDDDLARENLSRYLDDVQGIAGKLDEIAGRKSLVEAEARRIFTKLNQALHLLQQALDQSDAKTLRGAVVLVGRLLALDPVVINRELNSAAKALRLSELQSAMARTLTTIERLNLDAQQIGQFHDGVTALGSLSAGLLALTDEHDRWQQVESDLTMIENSQDSMLDELQAAWAGLQPEIAALANPPEEKWAADLLATAAKLSDALTRSDPASSSQLFRQYRRRASLRFYAVDENLKKHCDQLRKLGEPLDMVLGIIQ